jgi:hypothetical protein
MSGLTAVCLRDATAAVDLRAVLERCAARLSPDNIRSCPPLTRTSPGLGVLVTGPVPDLPTDDRAACIGVMERSAAAWASVSSPSPDGCYVLLRHDNDRLEVISDALASRTVWYAQTPDVFLVSTSQRAIVSLLGGFEPERSAVTWMATSGTLGPSAAWDRRLSRLPGDSRLTLDRRSWRLAVSTNPIEFKAADRDDEALVGELGEAILTSCADLRLDLSRWVLPLSGGMNSRGVLIAFLATGLKPRCVTWGLSTSQVDPLNDAYIAKAVAHRLGVEHSFRATDHSDEDVRLVLDRFLVAGEGRTEDFGGYTDGLALWRDLHDSGVAGVIRGDEPGWGYGSYYSEDYARRKLRLRILSDYPPGHLIQRLGLEGEPVPPELCRREGETFAMYNDRVDDGFLVPTRFAALNDIKAAYVEIANPLLTRRVVAASRRLPDHLRTERAAFSAFVRSRGPDIPFAEHQAVADPAEYLARPDFLAELRRELGSSAAESVLGRDALDLLVGALQRPSTITIKRKLRDVARRMVPMELARKVYRTPALLLGTRELAFRIYIASRMQEMLRIDGSAPGDVWGAETAMPVKTRPS